jgi:recombination protein RecT
MTTAVATKPLRQVASVKELLMNDMAKSQLAAVAASHMKPERMMRLMANAIRTTPKLGDCEPLTLLGAMMTSASLGLEPNTPLGHAYLIPFENRRKGVTEVQFIIGYKGMISLARRSGAVVNIHADVVYEGDEFSYEYGSEQHLRHKPKGPRNNPTSAYCHAKLTDGEAFIVLPWEVILETRDNSQGWKTAVRYGKTDSTPWGQHLHAMAKKTAVRRLFDELPISIEEVSDAVTLDDEGGDFRAFAFDPSAGVPPAAEGPIIEQDDEPEAKPATNNKATAKPAPEAPAQDEKPEAEKKPAAKAEPDPEQFQMLANSIMADAQEMGEVSAVDSVAEFYADQITQMKTSAPEIHSDLIKQLDEMRKEFADGDGGGE